MELRQLPINLILGNDLFMKGDASTLYFTQFDFGGGKYL